MKIGKNTKIWHPELCNIYDCFIGDNCNIGAFVEIGSGVIIGDNCNIGAFTFIPSNVIIKDNVFIGPRVTFTNDKYPPSNGLWKDKVETVVEEGAAIGASSTILPNIRIGKNVTIGAGSVVTKNVEDGITVYGVPAKRKL